MTEYEEMVRLVDGAYKNILEKFNPCARQLIAAGKTYLKALHAAVAASKGYMDAISRLARHAHQGTWGGCTDIGTALMQLVDVQKEIENQQMNVLKAFYVDVIVPLESNIEKDAKVVASEQKRFMQQQKTHHESYLKVASIVKKQRKKSRAGTRGSNVDKEIKQMQSLEEEKGKLDGFCESSLKQAITQERRRFGFVLERQCSLAKHYLAYTAKGHALLQQNVEGWLDIVRTRETLPESIGKIFNTVPELRLPVRCSSEYACSGILSDPECSYGSLSRRLPRSTDNSCVDLRSLIGGMDPYGLPPRTSMARAKSDFNLASSTASLDSAEYVSPSRGGGSPLVGGSGGGVAVGVATGDRPRVRALYAYLSSGEHQLSFHEGDVIALVGGRNKGWQYGVNLRNNRCGWFPIAYTEPHDPGDASDFDSFISGSDSSAAVPSSSSESSGGSSGLGRWRPRSTYFATDLLLPPGPAPRRPLSSFADAPSFPLRLESGAEDVRDELHHRGLQPALLPAAGSPGRGRGGEAGSSSSGVSSAASSATGISSTGGSCAATSSTTTAPATIHPVYRHLPVAGSGALRPPRRSMTSPCPFPLLPPPRLPPPGSLMHGSSDSGFGNEATAAAASTVAPAAAAAGTAPAAAAVVASTVTSPDARPATATAQDSVREEDEDQEEQPRENVFSSVKLKKVLTDDRSAPMIT